MLAGARVLAEMGDRRLSQLVGSGGRGLELTQQCAQLDAHRVLHHRWLVQVGVGEDLSQALDVAVEVATAASLDSSRRSRAGVSLAACAGVGAATVDRDGLGGPAPAKPGPRRAHKLTDEVIGYARQLREQDPGIGSARLADAIAATSRSGCTRDRWSGPWPALKIPKVERAMTSTIRR